ncbi:PKD domain-containing protein [Proteiniphilum sp. UBA5384]|uniref:PKD domain-containing protein n=1 Tax=Proteiniphilum sp. UBA5384 TaxID=1947279 RepID=UPI0025F0BDF9|nr:hypothetical protein [Proteiniphilum sp. UBA5384]
MKFGNVNNRNRGNGKKYFFSGVIFFTFLAVFSFSIYAQDTDNTEFWFVAPDAAKAHDDRPTFLMITTGDKPANVTISMPANSSQFKSLFAKTDRLIPANSYWKFEFSTDDEMALIENSIDDSGKSTNKGIFIKSDVPVSAYYQVDGSKGAQKEIFTLKGKKALGNNFYMPFQEVYKISTAYEGQGYRQIQIVATEDNTVVTVVPKGPLASQNGYIDQNSTEMLRQRTLNKGQTLLWREYKRNTSNITGTQILSNKPVAVTLFEDCVDASPSQDIIGDQMVPVENLGKNYIVVKGYSYKSPATDHVGILAVADGNTEVKVGHKDGRLETKNLKKGEYWAWDLGEGIAEPSAYFVTADKPVYCMHQSAVETELGGALLPSLYSISGRRITFIKGSYKYDPDVSSYNAMFLVFQESAKDGFILDGNPLPMDHSSVLSSGMVGFEKWMYAKVKLDNTTGKEQVCTVENKEGSFSLGYFTGNNVTSLYGYLSAFGTFSFGADTIYHCGDSYQFDAPYARTYKWTLPDNNILIDTSRYEAKKSGRYILKVEQDPYEITDTTYLKLQNFRHILHAPERLLENKSYNFSIELNPQNDKDNNYKAAYEWSFGEGSQVELGTVNDREVAVYYSTPGTKNISLKVFNQDANCDTTITHVVVVPEKVEVMYWKSNAKDRDWNNEDNWVDAAGNPLSVVPSPETKVYLPGNATGYYPSLRKGETDWRFYGQPEINEIVFRYGSELQSQHRLKYNKAYVNYNWYYYNTQSTGQPESSIEGGAKRLDRDIWHILAAPLKSMATGDFSLAGHPFSWQQQFRVSNPQGANITEADFSKPFATNDIALVDNNNAIAVKMVLYKNENGYRQDYLDGLKGIIEIPYFENSVVSPLYPAHNYDALSKRSYFYYFDTKTLRILNSPVGTMNRSGEAYRFVYEDKDGNPPEGEIYKMEIKVQGDNLEVMVGNPLLAPIVSTGFLYANRGTIDETYGYKMLSEDGTNWVHHEFEDKDTIPAWKAFVVRLKDTSSLRAGASSQEITSTVSFPLDYVIPTSMSVTPASGNTRSAYAVSDDALYVQVLKGGVRSGDAARLQYNRNADKPDIRKMILPDGHRTPEVFFISSDGKSSNLIQQYKSGEKEVAIGIKTSDVNSRLLLEFDNIAAFSASTGASVILMDKYQNVTQDLTRNSVYSFTQQSVGLDNQYVDRTRFVLQLGGDTGSEMQEDAIKEIEIIYRSGILEVTSDENIHTVSVYDLYGRLVFSNPSVNLTRYSYPISLQGKMYLVRVKTVSGKETVRRVMAN